MPPDVAPGERLTFTEESQAVPDGAVTLVEGATFAIFGPAGDIAPGSVQGVFVADTRVCSALVLTVDGVPTEALTVVEPTPFSATFVGRTRDRRLLIVREADVGQGMRLRLKIENLTTQRRSFTLALAAEADLAEIFAVKEGRAHDAPAPQRNEAGRLIAADADDRRGLVLRPHGSGARIDEGAVRWALDLEPRAQWSECVELTAIRGGQEVAPTRRCGDAASADESDHRQVRPFTLRLRTDVPGLARAVERAAVDLGGLRLVDPDHPGAPLIAAGAPWYMTLFGRDSLLTSWMALLLDRRVGLATVQALARLQGRRHVAETEEEPGRILHEVRFSRGPSLALADGEVYYGSADATPLFVMLVHELWRWGVPLTALREVLPAVDAALLWCDEIGDRDGDGYVEYAPRTTESLANQGWKDSYDSISFADGRLATGPIALAEVQAYVYAAWLAGAALAAATGDTATAVARRRRAHALQARFEQDFWLPEAGAFALALDGAKRPVDAIASNMGHCLWAGIVRRYDQASAVARWLVSPELFSGWGVRTLATSMGRYNPLSYHNGSVWPHDTAICLAGLRLAGFPDEALRLATGLLAAAEACNGRLPELFAGLGRDEVGAPVPYPASCSPQAWASAAPLLVVRALLGLEPDIPDAMIALDPVLPAGGSRLALDGVPADSGSISLEVEGDALAVRGLPREIAVVRRAL